MTPEQKSCWGKSRATEPKVRPAPKRNKLLGWAERRKKQPRSLKPGAGINAYRSSSSEPLPRARASRGPRQPRTQRARSWVETGRSSRFPIALQRGPRDCGWAGGERLGEGLLKSDLGSARRSPGEVEWQLICAFSHGGGGTSAGSVIRFGSGSHRLEAPERLLRGREGSADIRVRAASQAEDLEIA